MALSVVCIWGSGCEALTDSLNDYNHDQRVDEYEDRGVSHKNAERAVYEEDFFNQR
jgi:hypothetical protein